jgi:hypothetical protein
VVQPADSNSAGLVEWTAEQTRTAASRVVADVSPLVWPLASPLSISAASPMMHRAGRHRFGFSRGEWQAD